MLKQDFQATAPNRVWFSDITYIRTLEGWLYLMVVLDLYNRKIIGWSMSGRMRDKDTTVPAYLMALKSCQPLPGLIFHSDQGVQYACDEFVELSQASKVIRSISSRGNCYNNAVAESFFPYLENRTGEL